jgi:N-acetylmuramoyl-L-alanine amidase
MDNISIQRIKQLHPSVRDEVKKIVDKCDEVLTGRAKVRIAQGYRTFDEQSALYAQGRTKPGKKVTNAKAGQSVHNYGLAVDIVLIIDGKTASWDTVKDWDNDRVSDWMEVVKVFKDCGWNWGGDWTSFKDLPHFEIPTITVGGKLIKTSWKNLINLPKDKNGYIIQ